MTFAHFKNIWAPDVIKIIVITFGRLLIYVPAHFWAKPFVVRFVIKLFYS